VRTDFMKQQFGERPMDNMSAFDEVGKVLDKFMD
jgi:hypothetical protein